MNVSFTPDGYTPDTIAEDIPTGLTIAALKGTGIGCIIIICSMNHPKGFISSFP
jgi:hypothetical protein